MFLKKGKLKFVRPKPNEVFNVNNSEILKFLKKIRLRLIYLAHHKFTYNFQDCKKAICSCDQEVETSTLFLVYCPNYYCARKTNPL